MTDELHPATEPAIRVVMMPRDTNANGTIFGGVIMSYIDQAGFIEARRHAPHRYVSVAMDAIEFIEPVFVGDILSLYCEILRVGRTSLRVRVVVIADRFAEQDRRVKVTDAQVTYVAIDDNRRPIPVFSSG
jgi:acyl-CoA thioesterase YciA